MGNALPFLTETVQGTRNVMESLAKSPQPAGRATCGGEGEPRPRGGREREWGCSGRVGAAREGWEPGQAEGAALQRQAGKEGMRERQTYLRPDGRHAAGGAERRGGLRPPLFISPGRRAAPPPATPAGPGHPPGPPAAESAARPRRAEPGWAGPNRAGLLPTARHRAGAALLWPGARTRPGRCRARLPGRRCPGRWRCLSPRCPRRVTDRRRAGGAHLLL